MNVQALWSLVHRAMEEASAGQLRLESARATGQDSGHANDLIKWPELGRGGK